MNQEEQAVYIKGSMKMGGFANLMERVASFGGIIVTIRRPLTTIFLSFLAFKLSLILRKVN